MNKMFLAQIVFLSILILTISACETDRGGKILSDAEKDLPKICADLPLPSSFGKVRSGNGIKSTNAIYWTEYISGNSFEETKQHFIGVLEAQNWVLEESKQPDLLGKHSTIFLDFRNGGYTIRIRCEDVEQPPDKLRIYGVSCSWGMY